MGSTRASGEHRFTLNGVQGLAVVRVSKTIIAGAMIAYGANGELTQGCIDVEGRTISESGAVGSDIGKALLVGGGAYYVAEALRVRIPHPVVPSWPELANAIGYAALASELSQREVEKPTSYSALVAGNESNVPVSSPV